MFDGDAQQTIERANVLYDTGRTAEALELFSDAVARDPDSFAALKGLGKIYFDQGKTAEALALYEAAVDRSPDRPDLQALVGEALYILNDHQVTWDYVQSFLTTHPDFPAALGLHARLLGQRSQFKAALEAFDKAIAVDEEQRKVFATWIFDRRWGCDWREYDQVMAFYIARIRDGLDLCHPLDLMAIADSPGDVAICTRTFAKPYPRREPVGSARSAQGRIRIGYMTRDVGPHPVAYVMAGVFEHHDRRAFETTLFHYGPPSRSPIAERIKAAFDHEIDVTDLDDLSLAKLINEREIDILITLGGYTTEPRPGVLAHRPAPVQVTLVGYPGAMAVDYVDYLVADRHVIGVEDTGYYSEKIAWMPDSYLPSDRAKVAPVPTTRAQEGLPPDAFVLMAFTRPFKINPELFDSWMRILRKVPAAVLWLSDVGTIAAQNLRREALARGVNPDRLVFAAHTTSRADHLARQRLANLALDTYPYNSHSTAADALWTGLPIITRPGKIFASRVCAGLLKVAGLPDLVCESVADYEQRAIDLARDPVRLADVKRRVKAARKGPLFDTARYTRNLEKAYRTMYERSRAGLPAQAFAVDPKTR